MQSHHLKLAIAATFTSEPIEQSLYFWSKKLDWRLQIKFAPYNQVFQELLNPSSLLSTNQDGINIILLRLEDWQNHQNTLIATVEGSEKEAILDSFPCHRLPNNIEIAHLNRYETEYLYQEIFIDKAYLKHGINLNDDACVIDIGANIGLFTLFVQYQCPQAKIYSFEPAIHAFERLQANSKIYCKDATVLNCGLGNQNQEATFTFYPNSSVFSSFNADTTQDEKALRAIILNMLRRYNSLEEVALNQVADEFLAGRLEQQTYKAQLRTLSSIIDDYNIEQIDLLKLDAEKSELSILEGIEAQHWSRIQQIVMEVHDQGGNTLGCVTQLLKDKGFEFVVEEETLLEGSGLYNIYATRPGQQSSPPRTLSKNETQMEQNVRELGEALKTAVERSTTPHLVCLCPTPNRNDGELSFYRRLEQQLISELKGISSLHWLTASELATTYPVADYAAPDGNGHIPYTPSFFAALGTGIVRKLQAIISNPYKVIVLDCDHTLWKGVCGEDGATGVEIDQSRQALQSFIVSQQQAGKLICLCSKNNEEDVFAVFNHHDQMPLQRHHLVSWRINWQPKSQNLKALATELNLGLDSFIFIDDNPVECMEVRANCPQVLTLQLPPEDDHIPSFLQHIWAFDQLQVTQADQQRNKSYQQNVQRQRFQEKSLTFKDFLAGLQLDVDISPMKPQQLPRVAQLTQRTNQFNLTTIRRSEAEIQQLCNAKGLEARVVHVKDRFGDYGLVGLLLFQSQSDAIASDSFLLSCRVLGRGVEHQMLAQLGKIAQQRGLNWVEVNYQLTAKNQPALDFLESVAASFKQENAGKIRFKLPTAVATTITFNPSQIPSKPVETESIKNKNHNPQKLVSNIPFEEIANTLYNPEQIIKQIQANFSRNRPQIETPFIAPRTALEQWVAQLFSEVLNLNQVGIEDDFLELGGDSIRGAILINQLQNKLNEIIHFVVLLEQKTVAKLTAYLEQHYPESLTKLLGENASVKTAIKPVPRQKIPGQTSFPLSFPQQRLWFLVQLEPNSPFYNVLEAVTLEGQLNVTVLERSLNEIIRRHEILRTTFKTVNGVPRQAIAPTLTLKLSVIDLQNVTEQSAIVEQKVREEQLQAFDLEQSPLLRATLLKLGSQSHILLLAMHHIIVDGWSLGVLIEELSKLYPALLTDSPSTLPELPIQYADFTIWQRQWLKGDRFEQQLNYWKQQLADAPPLLELPTDRPRPPVQTFRGRSISFELNSDLTAKLKTLSQQSGATLFMTLLAALTTLLYRYSGQEDVLVGTPIANRNHQELEPLIGFFVNTLVMRTRLESNPMFTELLTQVRQVALSAYANQDVPFEQLVDELQIERSLSHSPLFQVMFALQNAPMKPLSMPGLTIAPFPVENLRAKFDLTLMLWEVETPQGISLQGFWQYNSDLFDSDRITRMVGHFQTLLGGIVADPEQRIGELPLLTAAERHQLLVEWNDTKRPYPDDQCIHQLFEAQVKKTPNAIAVVYESQTLTYQELNQRANQLAHYLESLGVTTETLVGICIERSLDMIVGLLGILKAGGAYVPLDPDYPQDRIAYILSDSQVPLLITQSRLLAKLPDFSGTVHQTQIVCLDKDWQVIGTYTNDNLESQVKPTSLAYLIYTSGSTGKPKGVAVIQQAISRLVFESNYVELQASDCIAQANNISFDAATFEIWGALLHGAQLVGITKAVMLSPEELATQLREQKITILFVTTALFNQLVSVVPDIFKHLRTMLFGGEAVDPSWVAEVLKKGAPQRLLHVYGPTESTTFSTWYLVKSVPLGATNLPIGSPISNTTIYVLDRQLEPVPIGVPGELYIGGDGLARGYLNRPQLTASRFIDNPFGTGRLYKTGDLVRYLPEGNIEFNGRIDNQVKLRGFRIELGEIEALLATHPQVREAVVILREDQPGNKRLIGYVLPFLEQPTSSALRSFLKERLPEYMLPAAFVIMEALPLTPNGKVDRRALPVPEIESHAETIAPCTENERILAKIWQDVLGLQKVGIHDNFFELGGDSIIGIQIIARANQARLKLTPKQLFAHQTIAELAAVAVTTTVTQAEQGVVTGAVPLTPIQHWFFEQDSPEPHHFNQAVLLEVPADIQPEFLQQAVQQVFLHHDALRLQYVQQDGEWQQRHGDIDATVPFQVVDLSNHSATEQQKAIADHGNAEQRAIDLSRGVLMRVMLFPLGNHNPGRLLVVIHHLAVDGVSWRILLEDLSMAYQQLEHRKAIALPPKTTSFKEWAIRLQEYAQDSQLYSELDYWLRPAAPIVSLPVDYPVVAGANTVASRATVSRTLTVEQTRALLQDVPSAYNTQINDVLLTALVQSFAQWTGSSVFWVHLEGHGREDLFTSTNLSRTVGWFTSLFPVLLNLTGIDHPGEALKFIKEQLRQIPQRGIGYGILRYLSCDGEVPKKLRSLRVPEVSFNYLGQFDPTQLAAGWQYTQEYSGDLHSPLGQRSHLLNVNGLVAEGRLKLEWNYSQNIHRTRTIEDLANAYMTALDGLITHCLSPEADGYTPSDFPEMNMNQAELDEILSELEF
ncbi:non-ribosomal peptide synthetase [Moorena producens]|nr:non-ribosomal peptide synthetase [Moorena producens]